MLNTRILFNCTFSFIFSALILICTSIAHGENTPTLDQAIDKFWSEKNYAYWMIVASKSLKEPCRFEFNSDAADKVLNGIANRLAWNTWEVEGNRQVAIKQSKEMWENEGEAACIVIRKWINSLPDSSKKYMKWNS